MKIIQRVIPYSSRSTQYTLYCISDLHAGSKSFSEKKFLEIVTEIEHNPTALVALVGDLGEFIHYTDKRFSSEDVSHGVLMHLDSIGDYIEGYVADLLWPIRKKILCITKGNHEMSYESRFNQKITEGICKRLKIPETYGGWTCLVKLIFRRKSGSDANTVITLHCQHGYTASRTDGALLNVLNRIPGRWDADIFLTGHAHRKLSRIIPRVGLTHTTPPKLTDKPIVLVCCGSYKKGYEENVITYTERAGYDPTELGCVKVHIKPDTRLFRVEDS